jgi:uncharacterized protein
MPGAGLQLFSGYGPGYVAVNGVRHEKNVIVSPHAVAGWAVSRFDALTGSDFGFIAELTPEIVVLGTGTAQRFPRPDLARG